jgi:outer membrane protein TolC
MKLVHLLLRRTLAALAAAGLTAAALPAQQSLDALVAAGLRDNLGRRQEQLLADRAAAGVTEARGRLLPSATLNARYTEVGGNVVDLGKLINPAFGALNQLLQKPAFPTDLNLRLPQKQETAVRIAQPLYQPAAIAGYRIARAARTAQEAQRDAATRQLALDIRSAYLNSLKAARAVEIYDASVPLTEEAVRLAERLLANGKATPDAVYRARAERSDVAQRRAEAARQAQSAREYVNLLLEKPLDAPVPVFADSLLGIDPLPTLDSALARATAAREELQQLTAARGVTQAQRSLAASGFLPGVSLAFDYGIQGNSYRRDGDFSQTSLVMSWNLFNGAQDAARTEQASLDVKRVEAQRALVERQVALQVRTTWAAARVAQEGIITAEDRVVAARRTWELTRRRYDEGLAPQIELLDARAALTSAELNKVITTYDSYLRRADLDRAAALYPRTLP